MFVQHTSYKVAVRQMSDVFGKCKRLCTTPEIVMLRCYGWGWQDGARNMIGIGYGFIKQLVICSLAQFFYELQITKAKNSKGGLAESRITNIWLNHHLRDDHNRICC